MITLLYLFGSKTGFLSGYKTCFFFVFQNNPKNLGPSS